MHTFFLILFVFLAPVNGQPQEIKVASAQTTPSTCDLAGQMAKSSLEQDKTVADVEYVCEDIVNPKDKAA